MHILDAYSVSAPGRLKTDCFQWNTTVTSVYGGDHYRQTI